MRYYLTILFLFIAFGLSAQVVAVKSNLLYDATATANLGLEIGLGKRTTLDLSGNYNAWYTDKSKNEKIRHALFQPEFRYYFCTRMSGHFIGAHAIGAEYNISGEHWYLNEIRELSTLNNVAREPNSRYEGVGYGGGIVYGYSCLLSNRLNLEFAIGAGYIHLDYDRYGSNKCAAYIESSSKDYFGLTKLGISLVYIIK